MGKLNVLFIGERNATGGEGHGRRPYPTLPEIAISSRFVDGQSVGLFIPILPSFHFQVLYDQRE